VPPAGNQQEEVDGHGAPVKFAISPTYTYQKRISKVDTEPSSATRGNAGTREQRAEPRVDDRCFARPGRRLPSHHKESNVNQLVNLGCLSVKRLVSFPLETGGNVLIEVEEEGGSPVTRGLRPGEVVESVGRSFEAAIEAIKPAALAVASKLRNFADAPEDLEVEFGLKFAGQAGAFIASASTEAQFRVKMVWKGKPATAAT
jgi:hypothetical protein